MRGSACGDPDGRRGTAGVLIAFDSIREAARRIEGRVLRTPLRRSAWLSGLARADVFLKLESLQPTFSFKLRGALNAVLKRLEETGDHTTPIVTASAGNHGRAMAYAASHAGMPLTVYAPRHAPRTKLDAIESLGAELRLCRDYDEAEVRAKAHAESGGGIFISPYSHPDVIAGAGTIGLELLDEQPDLDLVVVPIGGGGLISGIAIAVRALSTRASVTGVEVEASCPFTQGLAAGHIVTIDVGETLADGLSGNLDPDTITFDIVRSLVSHIALVSETRLAEAINGLMREERLIAEGAGAAATAAILAGAAGRGPRKIAAVVSGANIDAGKLKALV